MAEAPKNTSQAADNDARRIRPMTPEELRLANQLAENEILEQVKERNATDLHEGGRYLVNGQLVDAEGRPIKGKD
jgi:protocatechuate 3,4-dioxygenase beta subunit